MARDGQKVHRGSTSLEKVELSGEKLYCLEKVGLSGKSPETCQKGILKEKEYSVGEKIPLTLKCFIPVLQCASYTFTDNICQSQILKTIFNAIMSVSSFRSHQP